MRSGWTFAVVALLVAITLGAGSVYLFRGDHTAAPRRTHSPVASSSPAAPVSLPPSPPASPVAAGCRAGDPLANVYHPYRLRVLSRCRTATGVVGKVIKEPDGDLHVDLNLDDGQQSLLNDANRTHNLGAFIVEIVPADRPGCVLGRAPRPPDGDKDYGICTGAAIPLPLVGTRIRATGPWVTDTVHGWNEIHPAWRIELLPPRLP